MKVIDVVEILTHWHAGRRMGELAASLGVDPKTVRKHRAPALAAGINPGGPPLSTLQWYGLLGRCRDPLTGKTRRVWGFIMVLAFPGSCSSGPC
jgi:hypothetical protein